MTQPSFRTSLWRLLAAGLLLAALGCRRGAPAEPLNLILISVDALRADRLGAYGYAARPTSPRLDALAAEGVLFEVHVAASPWTTPSHLSLLTGLTPTGHGVVSSFHDLYEGLQGGGEFERLPAKTTTLAEALQAAGWATAAFTGGVTVDPRIGFGRGFDSYDTSMVKLNPGKVARLLGWVDTHRQRPFFVFWHTFEAHAPYLDGRFLQDVLPDWRARPLARHLARLARQPGWKDIGQAMVVMQQHHAYDVRTTSALYDGGIRSFDDHLGQLLDGLKQRGLYERTLIVLTSDHGEQLGERSGGFYNIHGHNVHEEMIRVPLVVKLPGQRHAGRRVAAVTRSIDVMPTLLELAGVPAPAAMQGASLRGLWEGGGEVDARAALSEALSGRSEAKGLRTDRHKLVVEIAADSVARFGRSHVPEPPALRRLFDLRRDPAEQHDLLAERPSDATLNLAAALERELRRQIASVGTAEHTSLDAETLEGLRALGYIR